MASGHGEGWHQGKGWGLGGGWVGDVQAPCGRSPAQRGAAPRQTMPLRRCSPPRLAPRPAAEARVAPCASAWQALCWQPRPRRRRSAGRALLAASPRTCGRRSGHQNKHNPQNSDRCIPWPGPIRNPLGKGRREGRARGPGARSTSFLRCGLDLLRIVSHLLRSRRVVNPWAVGSAHMVPVERGICAP